MEPHRKIDKSLNGCSVDSYRRGIMDELKLAKWAGFTQNYSKDMWYYPDGDTVLMPLDKLFQSLDACFKWFVPKLEQIDMEFDFTFAEDTGGRMCEVTLTPYNKPINTLEPLVVYCERNYEPALALCLAIEKLIDG